MTEAIFWALTHSLWQGLVIHGLVLRLRRLTRSPHQRYALLLGAQAALLAVSVATFCYEFSHFASASPSPSFLTSPAVANLPDATGSNYLSPVPLFSNPHFWMSAVVSLWLCGLAVAAARGAQGWIQLHVLRSGASSLPQWQAQANEYAERLSLRFPVTVAQSRQVTTPLVLGWLKPLILFPWGWASALPADVIEAALVHELMHIRRWDFLVNALQVAAESVLYYHPTMRFLSREIREEREVCCDASVASQWIEPLDYACALLTLEQQRNQARLHPNPRLCVAATDGQLMKRIEQITQSKSNKKPPPIARGLSASLVFASLSLSIWAASCSSQPTSSQKMDSEQLSSNTSTEESGSTLTIAWLPSRIHSYSASIEAAAAKHGVAAELLAVMMFVESRGNPEAESPQGALGLMQVMPSTAQAIAEQRGQVDHATAMLLDPDYNLDMAAYYLAKQFRSIAEGEEPEYDEAEQVRLVAIGYNGGDRALRNHLNGSGELSQETARYHQLVTGLWNDRHAASSDTFDELSGR